MKGYVDRFSSFVDDLDIFFRLVRSRHPDVKTFLVGHSVGGTVAAAYTILHQDEFDGLILSGALLGTPHDVAAGTILAARILSRILPKTGLYFIDANGISQDKSVVKAYLEDPLVYQGKIRARLGVEIIEAMDAANRQSPDIHLPILVMHGTADPISDPESSKILYQNASSADKILKLYEGYYHEIFNEPGREQVFTDMESWLKTHI